MFDGSTLPLDENLRISAELLEQCRGLDIVLEIECGRRGRRATRVAQACDLLGSAGRSFLA
jgi:fructose/tagatose bisphosphate aldolase